MRSVTVVVLFLMMVFLQKVDPVMAEPSASPVEQAMSLTLDLWREGRYDQLFERLSHRGKTTREQFVRTMQDAPLRPACCWQKLENFRLLNEKSGSATAYARVGLEGTAVPTESSTREFRFSHESGEWRMQLNDILDLAGAKKGKRSRPVIHRYN